MTNIKYEIIPLTEENITLLERIRYDAYKMNTYALPPENTFYTRELKASKYLVFGCYLNNQLIGACYTSKAHNSLYIEQLFILKKYQKSNFHFGSNLLKFVLANKKVAEEYFNSNFYFSYLDNYKNTSNFYKSLGYTETESYMKKRL